MVTLADVDGLASNVGHALHLRPLGNEDDPLSLAEPRARRPLRGSGDPFQLLPGYRIRFEVTDHPTTLKDLRELHG